MYRKKTTKKRDFCVSSSVSDELVEIVVYNNLIITLKSIIGLFRFGDVLDPIGDLREMWKAKCMLKKGGLKSALERSIKYQFSGLFYLGIPYGFDTTHWNLHRIYGRIRFAMMFEGFEMIGACYKNNEFVVTKDHFTKPEGQQNLGAFFQPVLVLRKL